MRRGTETAAFTVTPPGRGIPTAEDAEIFCVNDRGAPGLGRHGIVGMVNRS